MTDLDRAIDELRDVPRMIRCADHGEAYVRVLNIAHNRIEAILATIDAARDGAVATVQTITSLVGETRKCIIGPAEVIDSLPVGTAVYAAPPVAAIADEVAKHSTQDCYEHFLAYSGLEDSPWIKYAYFHGADVGLDRPSKPAPVALTDEVTDDYARAFHDGWLACKRGDAEPPVPAQQPAAAVRAEAELDRAYQQGREYESKRSERLAAQLNDLTQRHDALIKMVADGRAMQPPAPIFVQAPPVALAVPAGYVPVSALIEARDHVEDWAAYSSPYFQEKHGLAGVLAEIDAQIAAAQAQQPAAAVPAVPDGFELNLAVAESAIRKLVRLCPVTPPEAACMKSVVVGARAMLAAANKENTNE